jgi:hypothetical protein
MVKNSELSELINILKIRMKLAKEENNIDIAGIYAGVIIELKKIMEK